MRIGLASLPTLWVDALLAFTGIHGTGVLLRQVRKPPMAYFKVPRELGSTQWTWVSCKGDNAALLDFPQIQADLLRADPDVAMARSPGPAKQRGVRSQYFRLVLGPVGEKGGYARVFFTIYGSRPMRTLKALCDHWRKKGLPWVRVYLSDGGSDELPDFTWNDSIGATAYAR